MGLKNPIGQTIQFWGQERQIIGVVKNFNFQSLHSAIAPAIIRLAPDKTLNVMVRIDHAREKQALASLKKLYDDFNHGYPFEYQFMDVAYQELYVSDQRVSSLSRYFAGLGIFISCLGLFGLATFAAEQRSKEIGIRKVNGAKVSEVMAMLNKDFVKWVAVAFVIATPVAWYAMNLWLEDFAYRTSLSWWIFVLAGFLALVIALLTVSWHSYRAATRNPIEALRYE
jgi:putative ABC transport system permease protein